MEHQVAADHSRRVRQSVREPSTCGKEEQPRRSQPIGGYDKAPRPSPKPSGRREADGGGHATSAVVPEAENARSRQQARSGRESIEDERPVGGGPDRLGQPRSQGPIWVQCSVCGPSASRPTTRSTGHQCHPSRSTQPPAGVHESRSSAVCVHPRRGKARQDLPARAASPPAFLPEGIVGCQILVGDWPILRDPVQGLHAEILGAKPGDVGRPVQRRAADRVGDHGLDGRILIVHRIVLLAATDVRVGIQVAGAAEFPISIVTPQILRADPVPSFEHNTSRPAAASRQVAAAPTGPAPTTTTSASTSVIGPNPSGKEICGMTVPSDIDTAAVKALRILTDLLVPGDGHRWPAASRAINPIGRLIEEFGRTEISWLVNTSARIAALHEDERHAAMLALESTEPALFERLVGAVYWTYYTSVTVMSVIEACAETGPHETSPHFDGTLVAKVLATRAGQRRIQEMGHTNNLDEIFLSSPPDVAPAATYEHAARAGDFIFVAGQIAKDEQGRWVGLGDAGAQARQVYSNIERVLAHMGAEPRDVVKINTILVDRADAPAVTAERLAFFGKHRPPHTGVIITGLGSPEVRVEVEVVAYAPVHRPPAD